MAEMDAAGIDMQVLSLNEPGNEQLETAEAARWRRLRTIFSPPR